MKFEYVFGNTVVSAILSSALLILGADSTRADFATVPPSAVEASPMEGSAIVAPAGTPRQQTYLASTLPERIEIAENLGEAGAEAFARSKGLSPLLLKSEKSNIHGPDQIWTDSKGQVYVIEAKGGSGALKTGYGYTQGTPEYAVEASKELLKRSGSTFAEKAGATAVLKAASEGKMTAWVVRTPHSLGEPLASVLENEAKCSKTAIAVASTALKEFGIADSSIQTMLASGNKVIVKIGGAAGMVGGAMQAVEGVKQIQKGDVLEGSLNVGLGTGNVTAGTMLVLGKTVAGGALGAGMAVADGGKDVCLGLVNGNKEQTLVGTIKAASGGAMCTGTPVLVVIGGVTYAGVLIYENREAIQAGAKGGVQWAHEQFDRAWNTTGTIAHNTGNAFGNAKDRAWNATISTGRATTSAFVSAKDATWNAGASAVNATGSAIGSAKDRTWNAGAHVVQKIRGTVASANSR